MAAKPEDYHGRKPTPRELREIFRLETERTISNDWVIRHEGRYLQLQPAGQGRYGPTQSKALVCEWEDGAMEVYYRGERIAFTELKEPIRKISEPLPPAARAIVVRKAKKDHPWRQGYQNMRPRVPHHAATSSAPGDGSADRWNAHLRFALTTGLRFSAHSNDNINRKKGTFLRSFDNPFVS